MHTHTILERERETSILIVYQSIYHLIRQSMGNCSLKAVADATQGPNEEGAVRMGSSSTFKMTTKVATGKRTVPSPGNGVWKVKLVINPKDLEKILLEEVNTEALIQQMRIAANSTPVREKTSCSSSLSHKFVC